MELKWGRYDQLKQGYSKCMVAQWRQIWGKIGYTRFFKENHLWFWILGSQKPNASNEWQFEVETREIWLIEVMLHKEHGVTGLHIGLIPFDCLG